MSEAKCQMRSIGIPIDKVGERLKALHESLTENGMALKAETGVHIDCSRDEVALGFTLEVVVFDTEEEKENG
jgi:hypothetical protein